MIRISLGVWGTVGAPLYADPVKQSYKKVVGPLYEPWQSRRCERNNKACGLASL
jgi:hypothetical protein